MTKSNLMAVSLLSIAVAGCASVRVGGPETIKVRNQTITLVGLEGFDAAAVRQPDPSYPLVFVINGGIVVDQDPIRPPRPEGITSIAITWSLASDSPYKFPNDRAIAFLNVTGSQPPDNSECTVKLPKKKSITCTYDLPAGPRTFKYSVRILHDNGTEPTPLDPWVQQP